MLVRSLRAVLRKDSWMFCAGLFSMPTSLVPTTLSNCSMLAAGVLELRSLLAYALSGKSRDRKTGRLKARSVRLRTHLPLQCLYHTASPPTFQAICVNTP